MDTLWANKKISFIGLTGDHESGKTLFGLAIAPPNQTLVFDAEKSSESYTDLGFDRVDVVDKAIERNMDGYSALSMFRVISDELSAIPDGKYRVIMLDPIDKLESGMAEATARDFKKHGYTSAEGWRSMKGVFWNQVSSDYEKFLMDIQRKCETVVFTTHMKLVWIDGKPTTEKTAKGKEVLWDLAGLYLHLDRSPLKRGGTKPRVPRGIVKKCRLNHFVNGSPVPILPQQLPEATPDAIRQYILTPANLDSPLEGEIIQHPEVTEEEKIAMQIRLAEAQREAAAANLGVLEKEESVRQAFEAAAARTPESAKPTVVTVKDVTDLIQAAKKNGREDEFRQKIAERIGEEKITTTNIAALTTGDVSEFYDLLRA